MGRRKHFGSGRSWDVHSSLGRTVAELKEDGTIIDNDGQVLKLRSDGIITADGTVLGEDGKITAGPSGAVHLYRSLRPHSARIL